MNGCFNLPVEFNGCYILTESLNGINIDSLAVNLNTFLCESCCEVSGSDATEDFLLLCLSGEGEGKILDFLCECLSISKE